MLAFNDFSSDPRVKTNSSQSQNKTVTVVELLRANVISGVLCMVVTELNPCLLHIVLLNDGNTAIDQ